MSIKETVVPFQTGKKRQRNQKNVPMNQMPGDWLHFAAPIPGGSFAIIGRREFLTIEVIPNDRRAKKILVKRCWNRDG